MRLAFFLYAYNDVDQITPVMWKALQCGYEVQAVLLDPAYSGAADPRLLFLSECSAFRFRTADEIQFGGHMPLTGSLQEWALQEELGRWTRYARIPWMRYATYRARQWLKQTRPDVCVFEWGASWSRRRLQFLRAAHQLGIPTVALPHGLNIYLNRDVNAGVAEDIREHLMARRDFNCYDAYVFQSEFHRDSELQFGMRPEMTRVLGSARYCQEWQPINLRLHPSFQPNEDPKDRLRAVFMMPHWEYNVDRAATLEALQQLARQDWLYLVVKEHTRGSDDLPEELRSSHGFETTNEVPSVSLIRWAQAIINFGSSIGIEAILQSKYHVVPDYLHTNRTIFAETGTGVFAHSLPELLNQLRGVLDGTVPVLAQSAQDKLLSAVVYGKQRDVLAGYVQLLDEVAQPV